ncbi:MAG: TlyA family RNA methyltransferase [bacterium]
MKKKTGKRRLDSLLVERGLFESREKAKPFILAGKVEVGGRRHDKPGARVEESAEISVRGGQRFVSRGGDKLDHALDAFGVDAAGKRCLDVGAAAGGFTDCLLKRGAVSVCALDVGRGQIHPRLRSDPRVTVIERTNVRRVAADDFPHGFDLATVDVSFISLRLVIPVVKGLLEPGGAIVALVKPQFEAGRKNVVKGVVRDPAVHGEVLKSLKEFCAGLGLVTAGETESPLMGPKGNREFFLHLKQGGIPMSVNLTEHQISNKEPKNVEGERRRRRTS